MHGGQPTPPVGAVPYWRLSGFYLFFFAALGALMPYWGPYLRAEGFSSAQIGELLAILHATKVIAPNVWGYIADRLDRRMAVVRVAALIAFMAFFGILIADTYGTIALVMALFGFFWNAALPQYEANTFNHLQGQEHRYSSIRVWGSVGFIIAVMGIGELLDRVGFDSYPYMVLLIFAGLWLSSLIAPEAGKARQAANGDGFWQTVRQPAVIGFFLACFLNQVGHGPFYGFFSIYLEDHGYSGGLIGVLWAWGVVAEIGVFMLMHRIMPRFGARYLLALALALGAVRWLMVAAWVDSPWLIALSQTIHAASFGLYHAVAIDIVNRFFVGRSQGKGQALYSSLTFGAGVAVGSLGAGWVWDLYGGQTFLASSAVALLAAVLAAVSLRRFRY
ncbi:nucleoside:H+ symporter:Major facilitator superfamily [Halorhodospira halochloris]|uniref:Nucleoside:H+ symporter:Major facilitator superfamily n=1 Tax=Halorhodospira halochloris TaxID=1052 RepID=A0A0X8X8X7_HALHR|nr:MFS transporter [Halorhodospira halochloris]BAU57712.1 nucleoside:H+ symporter:Major facilitator superfamily [Halorhodospira halochloris]